ncbi:hypothetical protein RND71_014187 [Anisodus tanguticus]|uniref:AAA-type ATPase N-terminal domain-containing protein n=1 Tax=Anisodus tanguticus TaxID=243964 RepID=A0AAE1VEV0_9SOLA|nr:hypothetical protein RND71_014187 [Anisodus tanguticus]
MEIFTAISSVAATVLLVHKVINDYRVLFSVIKKTSSKFSKKVTMVIDECDGDQVKNEIYEAAEIYLSNKLMSTKNRKLKVSKQEKENNLIKVTMEHNEKVKDVYDGYKFKWVWLEFKCFDNPKDMDSLLRSEVKCFQLTFHKKHKNLALDYYLPYIIKEAKFLKR